MKKKKPATEELEDLYEERTLPKKYSRKRPEPAVSIPRAPLAKNPPAPPLPRQYIPGPPPAVQGDGAAKKDSEKDRLSRSFIAPAIILGIFLVFFAAFGLFGYNITQLGLILSLILLKSFGDRIAAFLKLPERKDIVQEPVLFLGEEIMSFILIISTYFFGPFFAVFISLANLLYDFFKIRIVYPMSLIEYALTSIVLISATLIFDSYPLLRIIPYIIIANKVFKLLYKTFIFRMPFMFASLYTDVVLILVYLALFNFLSMLFPGP
jgi:hypothetical protein